MKNLLGLLLLIGFCSSSALAQRERIQITGKILDQNKNPLEWASVILYFKQDSTMAAFSYSDKEGHFRLKNLSQGEYLLAISYVGIKTIEREITLESTLQIEDIIMEPQDELLQGVEIVEKRIPVLISKDTIIYDAQAFNVGPNATVEDLLKRLPGIEVENDGTIKAQGEEVKNVLVDGRRFFGNDPKMATKNLQADAIDKVQVYDRKSETAEFTGIDDGSRERTINLQLKPDRKNGIFGYASGAAGGPSGRYDGKLSLNKFNDATQMALLAGTNNINQSGFSFQDYMQFSGGMGQMGGRGARGMAADMGVPINWNNDNGFTTFGSGGVQYSKKYGTESEINTSYFYNQSIRTQERALFRTNFLPGDKFFNYEEAEDLNTSNYNHRINLNLDQRIDTFNAFKFVSSFSFTESVSTQIRSSATKDSPFNNNNASDNKLSGEGSNYRLNGTLTYRRKFQKRGRVLGLTLSGNLSENNQTNQLLATNLFFIGNELDREEILNQLQDQYGNNKSFGSNLQYTEPLGKRQYLEFQYNFNSAPMKNDRVVYDRFGNEQLIIVPELSNAYNATFSYHMPGFSYRIVRDKINFSTGLDWKNSRLRGSVVGVNDPIDNEFRFILPNFRFNYSISRTRNFTANYTTSVREPSILQLQPLPNNTDPLNIYLGNPNLKPEMMHRLNLRYSSFNMLTMQNLFLSGNLTYTKDKIRENQQINEELVTERLPINIPGEWDGWLSFNYGYPIKKLNLRINAGANLGYNWGIAFVNSVENQIQRFTPGGSVRLIYQLNNYLDLDLGTRTNFTINQYSVNTEQNQQLSTYTHTGNLRVNWPKKWQFQSSLNFVQYRGRSGVFNEDVPILSASISRFILPKDRGEIKLAGVDLLNRNVGISRSVNLNFVQDEQIISLGRYLLLEFRYNINASPSNPRGVMQMFRMI